MTLLPTGVPISSQWNKTGYFYPTQISQYALAHWSKFKINPDSKSTDIVIEDGRDNRADWVGDSMRVLSDDCIHFERKIAARIGKSLPASNCYLGFDLRLEDNVTIVVGVKVGDARYQIKYIPKEDLFISRQGNTVFFGYGVVRAKAGLEDGKAIYEHDWKRFTRNVANDLMKGIGRKDYDKLLKASKTITLEKVLFEGVGCVTNVTLLQTSESHLRLFKHAAHWLVSNQNARSGGWTVDVVFNENKFKYARAQEIPPGWVSAMGQGQAISVLTRAYVATGRVEYLESASRGLEPFKYPTFGPDDGPTGVRATFMNQHVWYEEYPTQPNVYILNGFMYSLLGLYDFWKTSQGLDQFRTSSELSRTLFLDGLKSLKTLLPFYDTGSGSVYDLRHFTMPGVEPKLARWDYHSLHVNLLYVLSTIDEDNADGLLLSTGERWERYMYGKKSEHN